MYTRTASIYAYEDEHGALNWVVEKINTERRNAVQSQRVRVLGRLPNFRDKVN